ncbi:hypothetical protein P7C73_g1366, partial [Tremellales sp. Uapishka_1]
MLRPQSRPKSQPGPKPSSRWCAPCRITGNTPCEFASDGKRGIRTEEDDTEEVLAAEILGSRFGTDITYRSTTTTTDSEVLPMESATEALATEALAPADPVAEHPNPTSNPLSSGSRCSSPIWDLPPSRRRIAPSASLREEPSSVPLSTGTHTATPTARESEAGLDPVLLESSATMSGEPSKGSPHSDGCFELDCTVAVDGSALPGTTFEAGPMSGLYSPTEPRTPCVTHGGEDWDVRPLCHLSHPSSPSPSIILSPSTGTRAPTHPRRPGSTPPSQLRSLIQESPTLHTLYQQTMAKETKDTNTEFMTDKERKVPRRKRRRREDSRRVVQASSPQDDRDDVDYLSKSEAESTSAAASISAAETCRARKRRKKWTKLGRKLGPESVLKLDNGFLASKGTGETSDLEERNEDLSRYNDIDFLQSRHKQVHFQSSKADDAHLMNGHIFFPLRPSTAKGLPFLRRITTFTDEVGGLLAAFLTTRVKAMLYDFGITPSRKDSSTGNAGKAGKVAVYLPPYIYE